MIAGQVKLRWTLTALLTIAASNAALAADLPYKAQRSAPPPQVYAATRATPVYVEDPALISPPTTPLLPGSAALPGYYGRPFDYDYQGAYYGDTGPTPSYFWRLPYACGIYGYC